MEHTTVASCLEDWADISNEFLALQDIHKQYLAKCEEMRQVQGQCLKQVDHQKYRMGIVEKSLHKLKKSKTITDEEHAKLEDLEKQLLKRRVKINDMDEYLPRPNGLYLRIILGNVNVSITTKNERYLYKDEYEKFKLVVTAISFMLSFCNLLFAQSRIVELAFLFLLVWYYCTLTIRESILKVNGSRIKGWWRVHHFISTVASAILLIWPDGTCYRQFRNQFMVFNCYIALVQFLQFRYQQGCLYRLRALGERHNMDITIEGFHSWMWKGLSFLLPFLFFGYLFQLYNGYTLYLMSYESYCTEWQVPALSGLFFVLFVGNTFTTAMVIPEKLKEKLILTYRYPRRHKTKTLPQSSSAEPLNAVLENQHLHTGDGYLDARRSSAAAVLTPHSNQTLGYIASSLLPAADPVGDDSNITVPVPNLRQRSANPADSSQPPLESTQIGDTLKEE